MVFGVEYGGGTEGEGCGWEEKGLLGGVGGRPVLGLISEFDCDASRGLRNIIMRPLRGNEWLEVAIYKLRLALAYSRVAMRQVRH